MYIYDDQSTLHLSYANTLTLNDLDSPMPIPTQLDDLDSTPNTCAYFYKFICQEGHLKEIGDSPTPYRRGPHVVQKREMIAGPLPHGPVVPLDGLGRLPDPGCPVLVPMAVPPEEHLSPVEKVPHPHLLLHLRTKKMGLPRLFFEGG